MNCHSLRCSTQVQLCLCLSVFSNVQSKLIDLLKQTNVYLPNYTDFQHELSEALRKNY